MRRTLFTLLFLMSSTLFLSCDDNDNPGIEDPILGTWRILTITVSQQQLPQQSPPEENITITFGSDSNFSGSTSVNQFSGRYELDDATVTMLEFSTTEVADTQFATAFYDAISEAIVPNSTMAPFDYSFDGQNMILVFGNSGQMVLEGQ